MLKSFKVIMALLAVSAIVGCTSGNPYVTNADRNEIITLGDSIFDLSGDIQLFLEQEAGQTFRNYTQSGAELNGGTLANSVYSQYDSAKADDSNIATIVMDGGGNDILIPAMILDTYGCRTQWYRRNITSRCVNLIDDVYVDLANLLNTMQADGVDNVIYLGYYELPRGNANLTQALNYGVDSLAHACANSAVNCTFLDPRGMVPAEHVLSDDIHPTTEGSRTLADLIWPELQPLL